MKLIVLILLAVIIYCLGSALYFMVTPKKAPEKTAKALTWRIALSLGVFCLLLVSFLMGWIEPHGI